MSIHRYGGHNDWSVNDFEIHNRGMWTNTDGWLPTVVPISDKVCFGFGIKEETNRKIKQCRWIIVSDRAIKFFGLFLGGVDAAAIAFWPFIICAKNTEITQQLINHEKIITTHCPHFNPNKFCLN
jgi:hypothetical protein